MSAPAPYKFIDKRHSAGYCGGSRNKLYRSATQTDQRKRLPNLNNDFHQNVSELGRETINSFGLALYANSPIVAGTIEEIATFAAASWKPKFTGSNFRWGLEAYDWMSAHNEICDISGWPYNYSTFLRLLIIAPLVVGDIFVLLTRTPEGLPCLQLISGHRVKTGKTDTAEVRKEGSKIWIDGVIIKEKSAFPVQTPVVFTAKIIEGVIVDPFYRPVAYRVFEPGEDVNGRDISSEDIFPVFIPKFPGQLRGMSSLGESAYLWADFNETQQLELLAQKLGASYGMTIHNETGAADPYKTLLQKGGSSSSSSLPSEFSEFINGIAVNYFRAGTGSKIEAIKNDRPSMNQQAYADSIVRDGLHAIGWAKSFSLTPEKIGSAPARIVTYKINCTVAKLQQYLVAPAVRRFDRFRLADSIDQKVLDFDVDWWRWKYQGPARITADAKYNSDVDVQEINNLIKSHAQACAERNLDWEDVQDDEIDYVARLKARCAEKGLHPSEVQMKTPNGNPTTPPAEDPAAKENEEAEEMEALDEAA